MRYNTLRKKLLSDLFTPVGTFLKVRQNFHQVILMESSDYSSSKNSRSFLCFGSLESFEVRQNKVYVNGKLSTDCAKRDTACIRNAINGFLEQINVSVPDLPYQGIFGFTTFDSVQYFETIEFDDQKPGDDIPDMRYDFYRFVIEFDHYHNTLNIIENIPEGEVSKLADILQIIQHLDNQTFEFKLDGAESSSLSDEAFMQNIKTAKRHLQRGDVFQVVLSRRFSQSYKGDPFNVYRSLRSINPSPYLYYFDYAAFRIFGSSPETQILVSDKMAEIHPIAGTFRRTGNARLDLEKAEALKKDPKENAEHVMLVDLARNDLSKHSEAVNVLKYKEVQFFSHVIHLVSVVQGRLQEAGLAFDIFADTFPAGTLSGAPKFRAMEIIDDLEPVRRSFYGGAIGMFGFSGEVNHAIVIRSFLCQNNTLHYQSGAGIVIDSDEIKELEEVNNKLRALKKALTKAEKV